MKILLIPALYVPHYGGLEITVRKLAEEMHLNGHTVAIITNRHPKELPYRETIDGISVTRLYFLYPRLEYLRSGRWDLWLGGMVLFPLTLLQLLFFILRFQPDIVNLHYLTNAGFFLLILHHVLHFRLIVSLHGGDVIGEPHKNHFNRWLFQAVTASASGVTACSQALRKQALILTPSVAEKSHVIHNGVDANMFILAQPYDHLRPYLLGVGKLEYHKGFDLLISAFTKVVDIIPDFDLLIVGDGSEQKVLQSQIRNANLETRIQLLGRKSHDQVASLMHGAKLIAIPSRLESFGIVGLEAWASGRPIIAARIEGLVEALLDADVTWVEANNPTSLAAELLRLCQNDDVNTSNLASNRIRFQSFSWEVVSENYLNFYTTSNRIVR